jgi:ribosomal protein S14
MKSLAHPAPRPTTETEKPRRLCAACGAPSGSISAGTGFPVVRERATGRYYHVRCRPGSRPAAVLLGAAL